VRHWLRPGLLGLHAFAVVAISFCVVMGLWQLGVYNTRQEHERADQRSSAPALLTDVWKPGQVFTDRLDGRTVQVKGRVSNDRIYVTGKTLHGEHGQWVVAPVEVAGSRASLLVVLGLGSGSPWAEAPEPGPEGNLEFEAVLQPSEGSGEPFDPKRSTIGSLSIPQLTNVLSGDLYSGYAIATSRFLTDQGDLVPPPAADVSWTTGLRNLAYALQWWVFAAFALFMWWRMASENVAMRRAAAEADFDAPVA
jgi:cytochrome oxidase assembly protein ShyY1